MTGLRHATAWLLVVVSVGATVVAALALWARRELFDSSRVAAGARSAVAAPAVHDRLVDEVATQVGRQLPPESGTVAPRIRDEIGTLVASDEFADAFEDAVRGLHAGLVDDRSDRALVLDLSAMAPLVTEAVGRVDPRLVPFLDVAGLRAVELGAAGDELPDLAGVRDRFDGTALGASALGLGALVAALAVAPRRARVLRGAGVLVAVAGLGVAALTFPASGLLVSAIDHDEMRPLADAVVSPMAASLRMAALAGVAAGALAVVGAAWWERRPRTALVSSPER